MKYVSMCVTVVLLVAALIFSPYHKSTVTDVTVGKGKGDSESLEKLEDVVDFLDFLSGRAQEGSLSRTTPKVNVLSNTNGMDFPDSDLEETILDKAPKTKYTSGTWHEDALVKISAQVQGGDYYSFSLSRRLSGYMTTTSSYYVSKGNISASTGENYIFDVEVYKDTTHFLIKINQLDGLYEEMQQEEVMLSADFFGIWFDMSEFSNVMDIDTINRQYLSEFQTILEECCVADSKQLSQMGVERIDGKGKVRLLSEDMEMIVDMKQEKNPTIHISAGHESNSNSMKEQTTMELSYRFENINNTVVALDSEIEIHNIEDYMKEMK